MRLSLPLRVGLGATAPAAPTTGVGSSPPRPVLSSPGAPSPLAPRTTPLPTGPRVAGAGLQASLALRSGNVAGAAGKQAMALYAARAAVEQRVAAGGFDPYPLGEARTEVVPLGTTFGVRFAGGSNHTLGSAIVWDPEGKAAHHVKHGFGELWLRPLPELGGRIAGDALGYPLEPEVATEGGARQRFQHGTLLWSSSAGVTVSPPELFATRRAQLLPLAPAEWLAPITYGGEEHSYFFVEWARKQTLHNPAIGRVHEQVRALLESPTPPDRVNALYAATRAFAAEAVPVDARVPADVREHLVNVTTLVALAAHALKNDGTHVIRAFPAFLWDGRSVDAGMDKAWHFTNHAMMAYVLRFDAEHGDGKIAQAFTQAVEDADKLGVAQRVAKTYHARKGALGAFVRQVVPGPADERATGGLVYAPRPVGLSPDAQRAFDLAVRIGDAHEFKSSGDSFSVSLDDVGDDSLRFDPRAMLVSRHSRVWGLQDPGVARDLTANRLGAAHGVAWYDAPASSPTIPHDEGKTDAQGGYAASRKIPYDHHLAEERVMLDRLADPTVDGSTRLASALTEVRAQGKAGAADALRSRLSDTIDALLAKGDHATLADYYGNFSVRHMRWGERLQGFTGEDGGYYTADAAHHRAWAVWSIDNGKAADVKEGFLSRFDQAAASFA